MSLAIIKGTGAIPALSPKHLRPNARQRQRDEKIIHLLNCTVQVLVRDGHARLSLRSVAAEAGVSLGTLQHYFEGRDALIVEAVRTFLFGYLERYTDFRMRRELTPEDALNAILEDIAKEVLKPEICGMYDEIWALARHEPMIDQIVIQVYDEYISLFCELVAGIGPNLVNEQAVSIATLIAAQSEGLVVITNHSSARGRANAAVLDQMQAMWPVVIRNAEAQQL